MNKFFAIIILSVFTFCKANRPLESNLIASNKIIKKNKNTLDSIKLLDNKAIRYYSNLITKKDLKRHLIKLSSKEFEGRRAGEKGQKLAANYIQNYYKDIGIEPAFKETGEYLQKIPAKFLNGKYKNDTENVLGFIAGTEKPEEIIIISAHYDHLGIKEKNIFFGADDNSSGTSAVLEIAESFQKAVTEGKGPKRSILFLNLTGEEKGLFGSKYYVSHPVFPLKNTIVNLNIDMIGRIDDRHFNNDNYIYLIGSDKISAELHNISEAVNKKYVNLELDYKYNDEKDPNRFYYRSDHYSFVKNGIPAIFYFNGIHKDYHKPTDTEDKINYNALQKRTKLIFYTAWEIANKEERLTINK